MQGSGVHEQVNTVSGHPSMAKVLGIGGIFFKAKDPAALINWYRDVIGLQIEDWGGVVLRPEAMAAHPGAATVFSPFKADTKYFEPSTKDFMINLAVSATMVFFGLGRAGLRDAAAGGFDCGARAFSSSTACCTAALSFASSAASSCGDGSRVRQRMKAARTSAVSSFSAMVCAARAAA